MAYPIQKNREPADISLRCRLRLLYCLALSPITDPRNLMGVKEAAMKFKFVAHVASAMLSLNIASAMAGQPAGSALGISGNRFTLCGEPTFLLGVSYFDAVGWRASDLDALQARRFNLIRIFLDWSIIDFNVVRLSPLAARGFVTPDGSLTNSESLLKLVRACAARGIVVDVTILTALYNAAHPLSKTLDMPSRERAVRSAAGLLKDEPNVLFDVCNEHDVAWNGKTTTLTHEEVAVLIRAARDEHPAAIVTVSSGEKHLADARNIREELDAGVMLVTPHFHRTPDWFDRTGERVRAVRAAIRAAGRDVPIYLQEEQRRGWEKNNSSAAQMLHSAREAVAAGAAGWVFHTYAGFDLRSKSFLENLDEVEREVFASLGTEVFGPIVPEKPLP